jgi:hypothetical protein
MKESSYVMENNSLITVRDNLEKIVEKKQNKISFFKEEIC